MERLLKHDNQEQRLGGEETEPLQLGKYRKGSEAKWKLPLKKIGRRI